MMDSKETILNRAVRQAASTLRAQDISRNEWPAFLDTFSRQHERWLVTVEVLTSGLGAHREVRDKPLTGISEDRRRDGADFE